MLETQMDHPSHHAKGSPQGTRAGIFDLFCGFSQIQVDGITPSETQMFQSLIRQIKLADELGFDTAWVGGAHFSLTDQNRGSKPPLPHFQGEMCLNTDILPLAQHLFSQTNRIAIGSAIRNILSAGGPIAHAESIRTALTWHNLSDHAHRRIALGYGAGRLEYASRAYGIKPRSALEGEAWSLLRPRIFRQASEIFLRLLKGESLASEDLGPIQLTKSDCQDDTVWSSLQSHKTTRSDILEFDSFWKFDRLKLIPAQTHLDALTLTLGSQDPLAQAEANQILPTRVFNLSITPPSVIEATHQRMKETYHPMGGPWKRHFMPRTVMVFVNNDRTLTPVSQSLLARRRARDAVEAYQRAMFGTVDETKLNAGVSNTIAGNPHEVAQAITKRFHPEDRLMLWFDFNEHESRVVEESMEAFKTEVQPLIEEFYHV